MDASETIGRSADRHARSQAEAPSTREKRHHAKTQTSSSDVNDEDDDDPTLQSRRRDPVGAPAPKRRRTTKEPRHGSMPSRSQASQPQTVVSSTTSFNFDHLDWLSDPDDVKAEKGHSEILSRETDKQPGTTGPTARLKQARHDSEVRTATTGQDNHDHNIDAKDSLDNDEPIEAPTKAGVAGKQVRKVPSAKDTFRMAISANKPASGKITKSGKAQSVGDDSTSSTTSKIQPKNKQQNRSADGGLAVGSEVDRSFHPAHRQHNASDIPQDIQDELEAIAGETIYDALEDGPVRRVYVDPLVELGIPPKDYFVRRAAIGQQPGSTRNREDMHMHLKYAPAGDAPEFNLWIPRALQPPQGSNQRVADRYLHACNRAINRWPGILPTTEEAQRPIFRMALRAIGIEMPYETPRFSHFDVIMAIPYFEPDGNFQLYTCGSFPIHPTDCKFPPVGSKVRLYCGDDYSKILPENSEDHDRRWPSCITDEDVRMMDQRMSSGVDDTSMTAAELNRRRQVLRRSLQVDEDFDRVATIVLDGCIITSTRDLVDKIARLVEYFATCDCRRRLANKERNATGSTHRVDADQPKRGRTRQLLQPTDENANLGFNVTPNADVRRALTPTRVSFVVEIRRLTDDITRRLGRAMSVDRSEDQLNSLRSASRALAPLMVDDQDRFHTFDGVRESLQPLLQAAHILATRQLELEFQAETESLEDHTERELDWLFFTIEDYRTLYGNLHRYFESLKAVRAAVLSIQELTQK